MISPTSRLSDEDLRARTLSFHWLHSMALRPGVITFGAKSEEFLAQEEAAFLDPFDLTDRSVIDIGAWNGFFSFAAKRRGARRVLATDSFIWDHKDFGGRQALDLPREELGLDVEALHLDPTEIDEKLGLFDVVLFFGVFYHLYDPIDVLQRLRGITRQLLLVETHQDLMEKPGPGMVFYPGDILNGDATNWWGPNPALMLHLLLQLGFTRIFYRDHPVIGRARGIYAAFTPEVEDSLIQQLGPPWRDLDVPGAVEDLSARG